MIRSLNRLQPWGIFLLRVILGIAMTFHGYQKLMPNGLNLHHPLAGANHFCQFVVSLGLPHWIGYVSVATEFLGGLFLLFGLLTRFAAFMVTGNMIVALVSVNVHKGYTASEYNLALITMAILLVLTGSGAAAIDRRQGIA